MWRYLFVVCVLASADASVVRSKRAIVDLDEFNMKLLINQFRQSLMHFIGSEYDQTKPQAAQLKTHMAVCKAAITARKAVCQSCAKGKCEPTFGDVIVHYLKKGAEPFVDFGNIIGDWRGWDEMGNFFEGIGKGFVSWGGWKDFGDFFEGIGKGIGSWSGWSDLEDIGKSIIGGFEDFGDAIGDLFGRRKRALAMTATEDKQLAHLYRALASIYSRESGDNEISGEARKCMEKCDSCDPFLGETEAMINSICGPELLQLNATVFASKVKLETIFHLLNNTGTPMIKMFKYPTPFNVSIMGYAPVNLEWLTASGYEPYNPKATYLLGQIPTTAAVLAKEYWELYD